MIIHLLIIIQRLHLTRSKLNSEFNSSIGMHKNIIYLIIYIIIYIIIIYIYSCIKYYCEIYLSCNFTVPILYLIFDFI